MKTFYSKFIFLSFFAFLFVLPVFFIANSVQAQTAGAPTVSLTSTVQPPNYSSWILTWSTNGTATRCVAPWTSLTTPSGVAVVSPEVSTTYNITCYNGASSSALSAISNSVTITPLSGSPDPSFPVGVQLLLAGPLGTGSFDSSVGVVVGYRQVTVYDRAATGVGIVSVCDAAFPGVGSAWCVGKVKYGPWLPVPATSTPAAWSTIFPPTSPWRGCGGTNSTRGTWGCLWVGTDANYNISIFGSNLANIAATAMASTPYTDAKLKEGTASFNAWISSLLPLAQSSAASASGTAASNANLNQLPSTKFQIGDRVEISAGRVNVRSGAGTDQARVATLTTGARGEVIGGPESATGYTWWNVRYDNGTSGWSAENYLRKSSSVGADVGAGVSANLYTNTLGSANITIATSVDIKASVNGGAPAGGALSILFGTPLSLSWTTTGSTPCYKSSVPPSEFTGALTPARGSMTTYTPLGAIEYKITCGILTDSVIINTFVDNAAASQASAGTGATFSGQPANLALQSSVSTKFQIGWSVRVYTNLNVRNSANGTVIGTQLEGATGTVIGGPLTAGGHNWWNLDYSTGADGWSAENYLLSVYSPDYTVPVIKGPLPPPGSLTAAFEAFRAQSGASVKGRFWRYTSNIPEEADLAYAKATRDGFVTDRATFDYWSNTPPELAWATGYSGVWAPAVKSWMVWLDAWARAFPLMYSTRNGIPPWQINNRPSPWSTFEGTYPIHDALWLTPPPADYVFGSGGFKQFSTGAQVIAGMQEGAWILQALGMTTTGFIQPDNSAPVPNPLLPVATELIYAGRVNACQDTKQFNVIKCAAYHNWPYPVVAWRTGTVYNKSFPGGGNVLYTDWQILPRAFVVRTWPQQSAWSAWPAPIDNALQTKLSLPSGLVPPNNLTVDDARVAADENALTELIGPAIPNPAWGTPVPNIYFDGAGEFVPSDPSIY